MVRYPEDYEQIEQIVAPDGSYDEDAVAALDVEEDTLRSMYETMIRSRAIEERGMILQRQGGLHFWEECRGEEASHAGPAAALAANDWIQTDWRQFGLHLQRGRSMEDVFLFWLRGYEVWDEAEFDEDGPPAHLRRLPHTVAVGTTVPQAVGHAWGRKYQGTDDVTLVQFGDGAASKGDVHEGMNFAGVMDLPAVFLLENNQWAISVPLEKQLGAASYAQRAAGYGFDGVLVDGNDVLATYRATKRAVERARTDNEPTLIEALTYRRGAHSTSDDPSIYRDEAEVERWEELDPVDRYERFLEDRGLWTEAYAEETWEAAEAEAREAAESAIEKAEEQTPTEVFEEVYSNPPPEIEEQHRELERFREEFGDEVFHD
ncbi:MAG: thiamine pyrophosphate-dependent enzyme [Haloarculaceae archaeon]